MTLRRASFSLFATLCILFALGFVLLPDLASAQGSYTPGIQNPLSGISSISEFFKRIFDAAIMIGIPICVFFIILSGFRFIAAQGNQEKLKTARDNFMYTIIGVAIFIGAWALSQLIAGTLKSIGVNV